MVGRTYVVYTFDLTGRADTYIILNDQFGVPLSSNDDLDGVRCLTDQAYCASRISWKAEITGPYYLTARTLDYASCGCPGYNIRLTDYGGFLPVVLHQPTNTPSPTPTFTFTPTPTNTSTFTPSPTPTFTYTPSPTLTASVTPTPSSTPTATPTPTPGPSPTPTDTPQAGNMDYPQAIAVNSAAQTLYVTSRDNDRVYMLNAATLAIKGSARCRTSPGASRTTHH